MNRIALPHRSALMSDAPVQRPNFVSHHVAILTICCLVLVLAFVFEVRQNQQVALRWGDVRPLPEVCALRSWFGLECPACGLTRSFICLARGSLWASFQQHRFGWLIALAVVIQIPYRIAALKRGADTPWGDRLPRLYVWTLLILLIANWLYGLIMVS